MSRWQALVLVLIAAVAVVLRLPQLGQRPLHNDEAVNAHLVAALLDRGDYTYNPEEFHGPTLHYLSIPFFRIAGVRSSDQLTDAHLRLAPVAFGVALVLIAFFFLPGLNLPAASAAAALTALSPAMVYYSRYFIHETLLVCFCALLLAAGWHYAQTRRRRWVLAGGLALGLMYATKETFVLNLSAMAAGLVITVGWERWREGRVIRARSVWNGRHFIILCAAALLIAGFLFTSFGANPRGPWDSIRSYFTWWHRAGGQTPHVYPWYFYFERLFWFHEPRGPWWSEGGILLLALVGGGAAFSRRLPPGVHPSLGRFLVGYVVTLIAITAAIPYKTPWCGLGFHHGLILLGGLGVAVLWQWCSAAFSRAVLAITLAAVGLHLGWQAWRANHAYAADPRNPYVFAHTSPDIRKLVANIEGVARTHPLGYDLPVTVVSGESYWPLPWYLRRFRHIGWADRLPDGFVGPLDPVMIVEATQHAAFDEKTGKRWLHVGYYLLRPPRTYLEMYCQFDLWKRYVETRPRPEE